MLTYSEGSGSVVERGEVRHTNSFKQSVLFTGLVYGKITPTDIDGFIDFGNRLFIFIELKYGSAELPRGQRVALERLCDASESNDRFSVVIVASHNSDGDIIAADATVVEYRWRKKWHKPTEVTTLKQAIDKMREKRGL